MAFAIASSKNLFWESLAGHPLEDLQFKKMDGANNLELSVIKDLGLQTIFFPFWNLKIPSEILQESRCVVFHVAPLPSGKGGSPIQNLIRQGYKSAPLNALRAVEEIDAGPILMSDSVSLTGSAGQILRRVSLKICDQILGIIENNPTEHPQKNVARTFKRIRPSENELTPEMSLQKIYDEIRMVDGPGYLPAFIRMGKFDYEFFDASLDGGEVEGRFRITPNKTARNSAPGNET